MNTINIILIMRFKNVVFFSPCKITGGAEYYFVRLAEYLAENHNDIRVYYVEFLDGFARKVLSNPNVTILKYEEGHKTIIPDNSIICISLNFCIKMDEMAVYNRKNSVLMMWFMHYRHLVVNFTMNNYYKVSRRTRERVGRHLERLTDLGVLKFLGNLAYFKLSQQFLFKYHPIEALPIPISTDKYGADVPINRKIGDVIRFCWLGRLDKEKSLNVLTYMNELEQVNKQHKVSFSIIGVGSQENMLKKRAKGYHFPIDFVGEKREDELDNFIRNHVDIGLASGTSSIEFALRKVPVIQDWLLEKVYSAGKRNSYHFIGKNSIIVSEGALKGFKYHDQGSFCMKLDDLLLDYHHYCEDVYQFAMNRSVAACGAKFLSALNYIDNVNIEECFFHIDAINKLILQARTNWMERLHLRRIYVPICKLFSVEQASI